MRPEGGEKGGLVVAEGTPEQLALAPGSHSVEYLRPVLEKAGRLELAKAVS